VEDQSSANAPRQIGTIVVRMLKGRLSDVVMEIVTPARPWLFRLPKQIKRTEQLPGLRVDVQARCRGAVRRRGPL